MRVMARRRFRKVWVRAALALCVAPFLLTASLADAQTKGKGKKQKDPCDPTYVPAKGETPPTCPGVQEVPLQPSQGHASLAATPPPVQKKQPTRRVTTPARAVVNSPGFRMTRDGVTKIYLQIHGKPTVQQYATRAGVTYVLSDSRVPVTNNRHALMTQYFNTPVADARLRPYRNDVHLQIDLRAPSVPTAKLIELVKDEVVMLEVSFPAGDYYQQIPTGPMRGVPTRGRRGNSQSYSGGTPPPGARGGRTTPPSTGSPSSVLGPPAP